MLQNPYQAYSNTQANTATPGELTLMLYNGAIRFAKQAVTAIDNKDFKAANTYLIKVQDIIRELMVTLNMDYSVSANLKSLYDFFYRQLVQANVKKEKALIEEIIPLLEDLRNTWTEVIKQVRIQQPAAGISN